MIGKRKGEKSKPKQDVDVEVLEVKRPKLNNETPKPVPISRTPTPIRAKAQNKVIFPCQDQTPTKKLMSPPNLSQNMFLPSFSRATPLNYTQMSSDQQNYINMNPSNIQLNSDYYTTNTSPDWNMPFISCRLSQNEDFIRIKYDKTRKSSPKNKHPLLSPIKTEPVRLNNKSKMVYGDFSTLDAEECNFYTEYLEDTNTRYSIAFDDEYTKDIGLKAYDNE